MRQLSFFLFFLCLFFNASECTSQEAFNTAYKSLLDNHLKNNRISYELIDTNDINSIESLLSQVIIEEPSSQTKKSFLINAYNFKIIAAIKDHYPIESVTNVAYFFTTKRKIGNLEISLNDLEELIIETYDQPLDHLVLNCGAVDCPNLIYHETGMEENLYSAALKNEKIANLNIEENTINLSKIFFWNKEDFGTQKELKLTLQKYFPETDITDFKVNYLEYDWTLNSQSAQDFLLYYPTKLYGKGAGEIKIFNNYYTQSDNGFRSNFFSSFIQVLVGTSKNINVGFDVKVRSVNQGPVGVFSALKFEDKKIDLQSSVFEYSRIGISAIGPRIKYQPFKDKGNINFLHAIYFVPMNDAEGNEEYGYSDFGHLQIFNNVFFEKELSVKQRLFFDFGFFIENLRLGVQRNFNHFTQLQFPATCIYNYYPNPNTTFYGLVNAALKPVFTYAPDVDTRVDIDGYMQVGVGMKHYLTDNIELEALYTYFKDGTPGRKAHTFNLGFRFFKFNN